MKNNKIEKLFFENRDQKWKLRELQTNLKNLQQDRDDYANDLKNLQGAYDGVIETYKSHDSGKLTRRLGENSLCDDIGAEHCVCDNIVAALCVSDDIVAYLCVSDDMII